MDELPQRGALAIAVEAMKAHLPHMQLFVSAPMAVMVLSKDHRTWQLGTWEGVGH
jgi:hypothetical protein